jgi:subtilisin family serine protease
MFHKRAEDIDYDIRTEFKSPDLFYGLSITVKDNLTAIEVKAKILNIPDVEAIWPVSLITMLSPQNPFGAKHNFSSKAAIASRAVADDVPGTNASNLPYITGDVDIQSTHEMTQVDKVHALGIKGKGVKIGIIDTGVDYRHPSLGGGFGPGFKIAGGYSFVQDDFDGSVPAVESSDPLVTCVDGGHGTHVTGRFSRLIHGM